MTPCDRCRVQPAEMHFENMCLCGPCAETLAWTHGVSPTGPMEGAGEYATGALGDVSLPGILVPPIGIGEALGAIKTPSILGGRRSEPNKPPSSFPFVRVMVVLGGVAAVGAIGLWAFKVHEGATEARRGVLRAIEKHPEMLAL